MERFLWLILVRTNPIMYVSLYEKTDGGRGPVFHFPGAGPGGNFCGGGSGLGEKRFF
jgi:hypothetical protein